MRRPLLIVLLVSIVNGIALRQAAEPWVWYAILGAYLLLSAFAIQVFRSQGSLAERFLLRRGDITIGALTGLGLIAATWLLSKQIVPQGSERAGWLFQVYALIGPIEGNLLRTLGLFALAAMEEVVWRGLVTSDLKEALGARRAIPIAATLYALAYLPTAFTLADPSAGPNPLVVLTALGSSLVWTFIAVYTNRLLPVFVSHAVFMYFASTPLSFGGVF